MSTEDRYPEIDIPAALDALRDAIKANA